MVSFLESIWEWHRNIWAVPWSKFSYLKELVSPKVRSLIYGLPFATEGYTRAKNILVRKYGKHSEVAHVQNIMSLPHINNSNPYKIHEFSEKLLSSVQALEIMRKLKEINVYVRLTLDKLQGIRVDLVRTDDDWQDSEADLGRLQNPRWSALR